MPSPRLELWVYRGFPIEAGSRVVFGGERDDGLITDCPATGRCLVAEEGEIVFDRFEDGVGGAGTFSAILPGGRSIAGSFEVRWCPGVSACL